MLRLAVRIGVYDRVVWFLVFCRSFLLVSLYGYLPLIAFFLLFRPRVLSLHIRDISVHSRYR